MLHLRYGHDVCLSVRLSVCLSVCDYTHRVSECNKKWKSAKDRTDVLEPASGSQPKSQYPVIPNSTQEDQWDMEKCGVLHFGSMHPTAHMSRYLPASAKLLIYNTKMKNEHFCWVEAE